MLSRCTVKLARELLDDHGADARPFRCFVAGVDRTERELETLAGDGAFQILRSSRSLVPELFLRMVRAIVNCSIRDIASNTDAVIAIVNCLMPDISSKSVQLPAKERSRRQARS